MGRIRTIKPEFPQSESMGRVSRDARLLFVQLWCICDDHGRTRAASRMLASLLFPYDDDAPKLIDGWLGELEREGCIRLYEASGSSYLEVCNWLNHQKIDRPSKPQYPSFDERSRTLANTREPSCLDQGSGIREGIGKELPSSTGGKAAEESPDPIFGTGLALLVRKGVPEKSARSFLGMFRKTCADDLVAAELLVRAEVEDVSEPVAWLTKAAKTRKAAPQLSLVPPPKPEPVKASHRDLTMPRSRPQ